jgi:hypothetical protein
VQTTIARCGIGKNRRERPQARDKLSLVKVRQMIPELSEYRFKNGKFKGKTMEHVMLRYAPDLYSRANWARDQAHLSRLVRSFDNLREKLQDAPIVVHCAEHGCKRTPTTMTLPVGYDHYYWPDPSYWCRKHGPGVDGEIHVKIPISFDTIESFEEKKNRKAVHRSVLNAFGIKKRRAQITEKFAREYFANLD